ncbi:NmrA family protein [Colletotrichum salicis]|uniref:NmrA family protein n=1 Tax=Colletotrichum salicis TaxID=1209931 RepID=A0A135RXB2_9PEZI|nr:NmrA family protein [Colletotrichum salicis]
MFSPPSGMPDSKEILVIGGTGAQGRPVVKGKIIILDKARLSRLSNKSVALAETNRYRVRVLTRNAENPRAKQLAALPNVTLIQGKQDSQQDLHRAFKGVYGTWVNTDEFTLGQKNELFYGIRAYDIARHEGVQHYVWAGTDYALKKSGRNERYHWGHNDSKGRITDFILAQGPDGMKSSVLTTDPYMDMLLDGMFPPKEQPDGSFLWANPAKNGKIPLIALEDVGIYNLWLFDNLPESAGLNLEVTTDEVSFADIARIFTEVTGKKGVHKHVPFDEYAPLAEPYPGAYVNFGAGTEVVRDESDITWRQNFGAWWRFWGEGIVNKRDLELLDRIHPGRIRSLAEWMLKTGFDGKPRLVLKGIEDWKRHQQSSIPEPLHSQRMSSPPSSDESTPPDNEFVYNPKHLNEPQNYLRIPGVMFDEVPDLIPSEHSAALYYLQPKEFNLNLSWGEYYRKLEPFDCVAKKLVDIFDYSIQELKRGTEPKVTSVRQTTIGHEDDSDPEPDPSFWDEFFERVLANLGNEAERFGMTSLDVMWIVYLYTRAWENTPLSLRTKQAGYWRNANLHYLHDLLPEWVEMFKTKKLKWTTVFGELFGFGR